MQWLRNFMFFLIFSSVISSDRAPLCSHSQALNCFMKSIITTVVGCSNVLNRDGSAILLKEDPENNLSPLFIDTYRNCLSEKLKNVTASQEDGQQQFMPPGMIGDPYEQQIFSYDFFNKNYNGADNLTLLRSCKVLTIYNCFVENYCYMKSHFMVLPKIFDYCQKDSQENVNEPLNGQQQMFENGKFENQKAFSEEVNPSQPMRGILDTANIIIPPENSQTQQPLFEENIPTQLLEQLLYEETTTPSQATRINEIIEAVTIQTTHAPNFFSTTSTIQSTFPPSPIQSGYNDDEELLNSIGQITMKQLKNLRKYGQKYPHVKKLLCDC